MKGRRVLAVLRSSPDFQPRHVQAMQRQLAKWAPDAEFECLSDVPVPGVKCTPLKYDWPDWWVKMELFRPDIRGDFLCTDLDNVFLGPLDDILAVDKYTNQRGDSNALAYYPQDVCDLVWKEWIKDPARHMHDWDPRNTPFIQQFGDGGYIKSLLTAEQHWEELLPGQVVNIAFTGKGRSHPNDVWTRRQIARRLVDLPQGLRVLLCARPTRPWRMPMFNKLYGEVR